MNEKPIIRVMIIDDHMMVRVGLEAIISDEHDMQVVAQAGSAEESIELFRHHLPDVTLVDLCLPGQSGVDLIGRLRQLSKTARFLVVTAFAREGEIYAALKAGAHAYLLKDASGEELIAAIRTIAAGGRHLSSLLTGRALDALCDSSLTPRESDVLRLLARGNSNCEIGVALHISEETAKTHVKHLYGKLGVHSRSQAIAIALKKGLIRTLAFC